MDRLNFDQRLLARLGAIYMHNDPSLGTGPGLRLLDAQERLAVDAAPPNLITAPNAGIPSFLTLWIDPKQIDILFAPMKAAQIAQETQKGNWVMDTAMFMTVEPTGEVSSYGDYSNNGAANANVNFPQRQSYHFQLFTQYGEKELARAALAKLDWVDQLNRASILILNKYMNNTYLFGVGGLQNYGLSNDPALTAPIAPTFSWLTNSSATGATVYQDVLRLFQQLITQTNGLVDADTSMTLVMSPSQATALNYVNTFNVNVTLQLKTNYPNLKVVTVPEYATAAGQLMQLIVDEVEGQKTVEVGYTEKMRAHQIIAGPSNWLQKKSAGTWGAIWYRPNFCAQMLG